MMNDYKAGAILKRSHGTVPHRTMAVYFGHDGLTLFWRSSIPPEESVEAVPAAQAHSVAAGAGSAIPGFIIGPLHFVFLRLKVRYHRPARSGYGLNTDFYRRILNSSR